VLEKGGKAEAGDFLHDSQRHLAEILRGGNHGGGGGADEVRFDGWMSGSERALLVDFSPAHGTGHGQNMPQR